MKKYYIVLKDTLFNLHKDDIIIFYKGKVYLEDNVTIAGVFDPASEPSFFRVTEKIDFKFKKDDSVRRKGSSFEEMTVVKSFVKAERNKQLIYVTCRFNNRYEETFLEDNLVPYVKYWFINSQGKVCQTMEGKDKDADFYRKKTDNMFATKELCHDKLTKLLK